MVAEHEKAVAAEEKSSDEHVNCDMLSWEETDEDAKKNEIWETCPDNPAYSSPQMTRAARPITTEVLSGYDGNTFWLKCSDAVKKWFGLTKVEPKEVRQTCVGAPADLQTAILVLLQNPQQQILCGKQLEKHSLEKTPSCYSR